jgi:PAS domain S-box-containing protein
MQRAPGISRSIGSDVGAVARQASDATLGWRAGRWAALGLAVLLIIGASALSYRSQQDLLSAGEAVDHTRDVLIRMERLLSLLKDTGAGMRSYLLTADKEILEPSDAAIAALPRALADLRALTADDPTQQRRLDDLQTLVDEQVARVARLLEAGRTQGVAVLTDAETEHARDTMDRIRAIVASMIEEESERDRSRTEAVRAEARVAGYPLLAGTLLSLALIVFVFHRMNGEMGRRRTAELSLRDLNETLEQRVQERTEQLNASEGRNRKIVDLIQDAIWIHRDGIIQFANPAALKLFGAATADAVIGRPIFAFLHADDRARALERTKTVTEEKRAVPVVEARLVGLDGRTRIAELHAVPFMQDDRLHVLSAGRDVTAQREAEA